MVRISNERVLLIGDTRREVHDALTAMPGIEVTAVNSVFDGIAELAAITGNNDAYGTVIAAAGPIERRPESAVRTLRELAGKGRVVLFGEPALEPLSRKMLQFGCDDYLITPTTVKDLESVLGGPQMRLAGNGHPAPAPQSSIIVPSDNGHGASAAEDMAFVPTSDEDDDDLLPAPQRRETSLGEIRDLLLADTLLDALVQQSHNALSAAVQQVNEHAAGRFVLAWKNATEPAPTIGPGEQLLSMPMNVDDPAVPDPQRAVAGSLLHLTTSDDEDPDAARRLLADFTRLLGKVATLQDRHGRLQKLAITDELTGVYNGRYFRHFLTRILERARRMHFPVTLLLFDIDDFKHYNDRFGHGVGDEILKQTAAMMKRCTREHDLVARIGGDEFAVVFWDKEGPRQPREPRPGTVAGRPPQSPELMFERFKALIASDEFTALGPRGKGVLGVSAGLAVYPYDAHGAEELIKEADRALMMGAKKQKGKNSIYIVGADDPIFPPAEAKP